MMTTPSDRRSSFGSKCVQCGNELIAPEWTEYRNKPQVHHVWHCWKCDCSFETIVDTKVTEDPTTGDNIFPSRLVA